VKLTGSFPTAGQTPLPVALWLNYRGWRGLYHVIVEPWTSIPANLAQAHEQKTSRSVNPGEEFAVEVKATVYRKPESWKRALERLG